MKRISTIIFVLAAQFIVAQQYGKVEGTVTLDGEPLLGGNVYLKSQNGYGTVSDENGNFILESTPVGEREVVFSYVGASSAKIKVTVKEGVTSHIEANLESNLFLDEVVISVPGSRLQKDLVVNVEKQPLTKINIASSVTLAESITNLNGVSQNSTGGSIGKPVIRGLTSNRVVTYAQGTRIENQQWGAEHGLGVSNNGIKSVEVIKGPASLLYGSDAIGGVLYFVEENYTSKGVEGAFETGYFTNAQGSQNKLGVKTNIGDFKTNVYIGYNTSGDYQISKDGQTEQQQALGQRIFNTRFNEKSAKISLGLIKDEITSKLTYSYLNNFFGIPAIVPFVSDFTREFVLPFQDVTQHNIAFENNIDLNGARANITLGYAINDRQEFNEVEEAPDLHLNLNVYSYNIKVSDFLKSDKIDLVFGGQGLFQKNENKGTVFLIPDGSTAENGVFGLFNYKASDRLRFQSGLRFDSKVVKAESVEIDGISNFADFDNTYNTLNYSLGTKYDLGDVSLRFNIASGYRAPNTSELLSNGEHGGVGRIEVGNQNLKSESATQFDFAVSYSKNGFKLILNPFYNSISNYIFIAPTGERGEENLPIFAYLQENATLFGGEVNINYLPEQLRELSLQTAVALTYGNNSDNDPLPFIPPVNFNSRLNYDFNIGNDWKLHSVYLQMQNYLRQDRIAQEELPNDAYTLINLGIGASYKKVAINFTIKNIFDTVYTDHLSRLKTIFEDVAIPNQGRDVVFNLRYTF
ncbi:TonB-dependent receptor [Maribacter sp. 2304DJ31-5]|uniref:TonB-dependent receptor n=1 Tax=Maribacter sp. 2304DJ31-5 TaxID=3386273 RepID=UPI0039BC58CD